MSSPPHATALDPGSEAALRAKYGARHRWLLLVTVMVGVIASIMSSTVVNVAIPDLSQAFELTQDRAQWVSSGFMLASTVTMLITPWLLARFGYRATYAGCMGLLMAGGLLGGLAQNYPLVLLARVIEGLATGVVMPIPALIIMRAFGPHEQGRAGGLFGIGVVLAPALGPSVGGLLVDAFGWRSIFFMVVPFCLLCLGLGQRYVPTTGPDGHAARRDEPLDWIGLVTGAAGTLSLLQGLVALRGASAGRAGLLLATAALCLLAFVAWQGQRARRGQTPLMNLQLFAVRSFAMGSLVAMIYGTVLFGSTYLLPVCMQLGLGLSASSVGAVLLPSGLVLAVTIALAARLADRRPAGGLINIGLVLLALSFPAVVALDLQSGLWLLVAFVAIGRVGLGFILPALNLGALRGLNPAQLPQGSSAISFVRTLGGAAGVSLCAVLLEWRAQARGTSLTEGAPSLERLAAFEDVFLMLAALCALAMLAARHLNQPVPRHPGE